MTTISQNPVLCQEVPPGNWPVNEPITYLPSPAQAKQHTRIKAIVARAVTGDWADNSLDAVCGALLIAGATEDGCWMWRGVIAAGRARRDMEAGLMTREAFEGLYGDEVTLNLNYEYA